MPKIELDQELLARRAGVEPLIDLVAQKRPDQTGDQHIDRDRRQHDQRQRRRKDEQDRDENDREKEINRRRQPLAGEEAADGLELAHARDRLTGRAGLEIAKRQPQQVIEQPAAELNIDPAGGMAERIGAQVLQRDVEQADRGEPDDDDDQGSTGLCAPAPCR